MIRIPVRSRPNLMESAPLFFPYLPSLVSCGELFITKLHPRKADGFLNGKMLALDVCVLKVTFIQETFPPIIMWKMGGAQTVQVDFSVSRGWFSTSMMSREEGRVKTPWHHTFGPMLVGAPRLPCLHFYHQRCFEIGGELLGSSLARKEIFWDWNLLYTYPQNTRFAHAGCKL